jgi:4-amino-4-deoxy-L-arabinose transferase-like glycosyltransferase
MGAETSAVPRRTAVTFAALTLWLLGIALVRPLSVDESQYVAATALAAQGLLPYRDFAYLQTPLQPLLFAPLQWVFAGHLLLAMRVANALLSLITIALVYGAARRMAARESAALAAAAMLASCQSFLWCAGVARNDVLPAALMAAGLWLIVKSAGWSRFGAGLAFGLAASAKISYAVPAAAVFVTGVWTSEAAERRRALWFAAGVVAGLLPTVVLAAFAPGAFLAEVIVFPAMAPSQYYAEIGKSWRLGPDRFARLIAVAAIGPALIAAIEVGRASWLDPRTWLGDRSPRVLLAASLGGLLSAALNTPFQIFYLLPALPPLFVLAALVLSADRKWIRSRKGLWGISIAAGFVPALAWFVYAIGARSMPALEAERGAATVGAALRAAHVEGPVAALGSQYVADSGAELDRRFAAGPFLYRTRGFVSAGEAREWHIVTRDQAGSLAEVPPAAIVTGDYPDGQVEQEVELAVQAKALGYRPAASAGGFIIWTRG